MSHSRAGRPPEHPPEPSSGAIYPPREDSELLLPFAHVTPGTSVLEVCAGGGVASLEAARRGARVVATDLNPWALRVLRRTALAERLNVSPVRTDLAAGLGVFDRVLANPPYLPTRPEERDPDPWHNLALDGGPDGCRVTGRLVESLAAHLVPGGSAFVVVSSLQDPVRLEEIGRRWESEGRLRSRAAERALPGERLEVWRFDASVDASSYARRARRPPSGSGTRPRTLPGRRGESSPGAAPGRTSARGAASTRRRSPPGL
jgi:release factor glutamine methyltransferase